MIHRTLLLVGCILFTFYFSFSQRSNLRAIKKGQKAYLESKFTHGIYIAQMLNFYRSSNREWKKIIESSDTVLLFEHLLEPETDYYIGRVIAKNINATLHTDDPEQFKNKKAKRQLKVDYVDKNSGFYYCYKDMIEKFDFTYLKEEAKKHHYCCDLGRVVFTRIIRGKVDVSVEWNMGCD